MDWFDSLLWPLKVAVAWIMVLFHDILVWAGLESSSGLTWALSIVGLVIVIRIVLIPLFVRQIRASRGMQMLSPELQAIQKKYKNKTDPASREAMSRETMALYRKHGTNPFSSCLPILLQSPIFFALFRVLYSLGDVADGTYTVSGNVRDSIGPLTQSLAAEANSATIFGAPLSATFMQTDLLNVRIVTVLLIVAMSVTTFTTQRQLTQKNLPPSAQTGPMAQQQKMLLYILPLVFAISGVNFPIGVLIYWTTTNVWSMGQQFYVIRRMPAPGSAAEKAAKARAARKRAKKGLPPEPEPEPVAEEKPKGQRVQPKRKDRQRSSGSGGQGQPGREDLPRPRPTAKQAGRTGPAQQGPQGKSKGKGAAKPGSAKPGSTKPSATNDDGPTS